MIIKNLIKNHIDEDNIEHIIFHSGKIVINETLLTIGFLIALYGIFYVVAQYIHETRLPWIFWCIGLGFFVKYAYDFFNKYADCIVLSKDWLTFFTRDGFYKYKTEFFDRNQIETISQSQDTIRDKIFGSGDLLITLDHWIEYPFEETSSIKYQIKKLMKAKENYTRISEIPADESIAWEHIEILTEALSEVIKDYLGKRHK